jgi:integrase/recombinase XerC
VHKFLDKYKNYLQYERNYSVHTVDAYISDIEQFIEWGAVNVHDIDADTVRRWMMELMDAKVKASSVNRKLSALQNFFRHLKREGIIDTQPLKSVTGPKKPNMLPHFVKEKDMNEILDAEVAENNFTAVRDNLMTEMLYQTGIRCSELTGIRDADIDMDAMTLKVTGKRNKQRIIPFADRLKGLLDTYINVRAREAEAPAGGAFFIRRDGRPLTSAIVYYSIKKKLSCVEALGKRSPHVLRHTFATSMLNGGAEMSSVRTLLGHSSLASTSIYTHLTFEELKKQYHLHPRNKK